MLKILDFLTFDVLCHVKFLYPAQVLTSWEKYSRKVFSENLDSGKPLESRFKATSCTKSNFEKGSMIMIIVIRAKSNKI